MNTLPVLGSLPVSGATRSVKEPFPNWLAGKKLLAESQDAPPKFVTPHLILDVMGIVAVPPTEAAATL